MTDRPTLTVVPPVAQPPGDPLGTRAPLSSPAGARVAELTRDWQAMVKGKDATPETWLALLTGRVGCVAEQISHLTLVGPDYPRATRAARQHLLEVVAVAMALHEELGER